MQIVETTNEGLKRGYTVTIPAKTIAARIDSEVQRIAPQVRMPGFRPGKVPANLVKKMHGDALHSDALNAALRESVDSLISEKQLRPAFQPNVSLGEGYEQGKDAQLTVELEVLPAIETPSIEGLKLEKLNVAVSDEQVDEAVAKFAAGQKSFKDAPKTRKAQDGDQLVIDFLGKLGASKKGASKYESDGAIMDAMHEFAEQEHIWLWTASQPQRGKKERKVIDNDDLNESQGKIEGSDLFLSANKREEGKELYWWIGKHRAGPSQLGCGPFPHDFAYGRICPPGWQGEDANAATNQDDLWGNVL